MSTAGSITHSDHSVPATKIPVAVQILSVIGFGVFSIVAVSLAFAENWIAGLVVGVVLAVIWSGSRTFGGGNKVDQGPAHIMAKVVPSVRDQAQQSSGNTSFDAYREETLKRLEEESRDFDAFLTRLREARDSSEFEQFMDDRVKKHEQSTAQDDR